MIRIYALAKIDIPTNFKKLAMILTVYATLNMFMMRMMILADSLHIIKL